MVNWKRGSRLKIVAITLIALFVSLDRAAALARAEQKPSSALGPVSAAVDEQTLIVVRADLTRVDVAATEAWIREVIEQSAAASDRERLGKELAKTRADVDAWLAKFRDAGGREIDLVFGMAELAARGEPIVVVPLGSRADAAALGELLRAGSASAERVGDALVVGSNESLTRIKASKAVERPDFAKAIESCGDAPIRVGVATSADTRRAIEELAPKLPAELGGQPGSVVTQGMLWASLSIQPPPHQSLKLVIQSKDAEAAKALAGLIDQLKLLVLSQLNARAGLTPIQAEAFHRAVSLLLDAATPQAKGDQLVASLGEADASRLAGLVLSGPMQRQRLVAARVQSANNLRQLTLACLMWGNDRKGQPWPDDLMTAIKDVAPDEQTQKTLTSNPARPGTGYVYLKPSGDVKAPSERIVIYDAAPSSQGDDPAAKDAGRNVAFMDGHVEFWPEASFQEKLKAQKAAAPLNPNQQ